MWYEYHWPTGQTWPCLILLFITTYANHITFNSKLQVAKPGDLLILYLNLSTRICMVDSDPYLWTMWMLCQSSHSIPEWKDKKSSGYYYHIKLGKGHLHWQNLQYFSEIFQVLKNSWLLAHWYVSVSCLNSFIDLCIVHKWGATCTQLLVATTEIQLVVGNWYLKGGFNGSNNDMQRSHEYPKVARKGPTGFTINVWVYW